MSKDNIRRLLQELIVNFNGEEYDIPKEEVDSIVSQLEKAEEDESGNITTRKYSADKSIERMVEDLPQEDKEATKAILNVFTKSGLKPQIVKTIINAVESGEDMPSDFFSGSPTFGEHTFPSPTWQNIVRIQNSGRGNTIGQGEAALSLYLAGVTPDSGSAAHDLFIAGLGDVHVKEKSSSLAKPDVPMGKSLDDNDKSAAWYQSIVAAASPKKPPTGIGSTYAKQNARAILDEFARLTVGEGRLGYSELADLWQEDIEQSFLDSVSWGGAAAIIFVDKTSLNFVIEPPANAVPWRFSSGSWRVSRRSAEPGGRWANALKAGTAGLSKDDQTPPEYGTAQKENLVRQLVRESLIQEELTKADKREIDKLIKKAIEKDRAEQKKLVRKEIEDELVKSLGKSFFRQPGKIRKTIIDVCQEELAKEMQKGSKMEKSVVDVTKKVLSAWHELLYKQQHIINRVKI